MARAIEDAFGVVPADLYATTEGLWGATCEHGDGHHLFEDVTLVENVDGDGRPVPPGVRGARLLVTNLANRVQPLIRLEVSDVATVDPDPCPCGRTLLRVRGIEGRSEEVLRLPGPRAASPCTRCSSRGVTRDRHVREFQVVQHGGTLRLRLAVRDGADAAGTAERVQAQLVARLASLGVSEPPSRSSSATTWPARRAASSSWSSPTEARRPAPRLRLVSSSVQHVRIREVGPRDGFQNEPEVIATGDKVRLIEMLASTGLRRLEVTSFVRADVIPQLSDAREVLEAIEVPEDVALSVLIPNERGLENALELRDRFHEINVFMSATEATTWPTSTAPSRSR